MDGRSNLSIKLDKETYSKQVRKINGMVGSCRITPSKPLSTFPKKAKAYCYAQESMKDAEARSGLLAELLQQEYDLRIKLAFLEQRLMEEMQKPEEQQNKTNISNWEKRKFSREAIPIVD